MTERWQCFKKTRNVCQSWATRAVITCEVRTRKNVRLLASSRCGVYSSPSRSRQLPLSGRETAKKKTTTTTSTTEILYRCVPICKKTNTTAAREKHGIRTHRLTLTTLNFSLKPNCFQRPFWTWFRLCLSLPLVWPFVVLPPVQVPFWSRKTGTKTRRHILQGHLAPNQNSGKKGSIARHYPKMWTSWA